MTFTNVILTARKLKESSGKGSKLTLDEFRSLRESYKNGEFNDTAAAKPATKAVNMREAVERYRAYKKEHTGTSRMSLQERANLCRNLSKTAAKPAAKTALTESRKNSVAHKFFEAEIAVYHAKKALREGDLPQATDYTNQAVTDVQAVDAAQNVPENIKTGIQTLKASIDDLAVQCGITPQTDLNANPNAAVPPVDGQPGAGAMPAAPAAPEAGQPATGMAESQSIARRIAQRNAAVKALSEGLVDSETAAGVGAIPKCPTAKVLGKVDAKTDEDHLAIPSTATLEKGSKGTGIHWPTKPITAPGTMAAPGKEGKPFKEQTLDEQYVTRFLENEKTKIRISDIYKLGNGMLG